jgi:uncharacterized surface protein with fasciclin (FAS1) repeats
VRHLWPWGLLASAFVAVALPACAGPSRERPPARASLAAATLADERPRATTRSPARGDVADLIVATEGLRTFGLAIEMTRMGRVLREAGPFVVFAPTDDAFLAAGADTLSPLFATRPAMATLVMHHTLATGSPAAGWNRSMDTGFHHVTRDRGTFVIDGCEGGPPLLASNGIVVPVRCVLLPTGQ